MIEVSDDGAAPPPAMEEDVNMSKSPFVWEPSDHMVLTGPGGLGVVGQLVASLPLGTELNRTTVPGAEHPDISHRDVVVSRWGCRMCPPARLSGSGLTKPQWLNPPSHGKPSTHSFPKLSVVTSDNFVERRRSHEPIRS